MRRQNTNMSEQEILVDHYIPHDQAQEYEVSVHAVNGWLDTLSTQQTESANTESASTP